MTAIETNDARHRAGRGSGVIVFGQAWTAAFRRREAGRFPAFEAEPFSVFSGVFLTGIFAAFGERQAGCPFPGERRGGYIIELIGLPV